ncbi:MAG: 30S ribosomal protein S7 [Limnochordia bacterium]|jgi:small subunit ribosomal protein S7|nr:30S ribosomal protein S7 [Limnochordia bacterium]MDD2629145.1 30S ribosomal protein S7 [Limnochordia bacterium]MDD4517086.1 30S ribosomal protein S7 [Limnochordia bacterium]
MPRRGNVPKRDVLEDPVYNSKIVTRLVNKVMIDGKRSVAERTVYSSLDLVQAKMQKEPLEVLETAMKNIQPVLEVRPRRVGGATYQVPMEVRPERRSSLAFRWLIEQSRQRGEKTMAERLAGEIMEAANNTGGAVRKKEEMHRMAEANKAFAHYRW